MELQIVYFAILLTIFPKSLEVEAGNDVKKLPFGGLIEASELWEHNSVAGNYQTCLV